MASTRYKDGDVTVTLTGDLEQQMRELVARAMGGALEIMEGAANKVAADARAEWYGSRGVRLITGQTGDIRTVTTIDVSRSVVRVAVGSTDTEGSAKQPRVVFVHSPGPMGRKLVSVSVERWRETPRYARGPFSIENVPAAFRAKFKDVKFPAIYEIADNAGKGHGYLLEKLVKAPMRKQVSEISFGIADAIAKAAE